MKFILKRVGKDFEILETDRKYKCDLLDDIFGKDFSFDKVKFDDNIIMFCDDLGALENLPLNFLITTTVPSIRIQEIYGDVIFIKHKPLNLFVDDYDYEIEDMTEDDIEYIKSKCYFVKTS